MIKKLKKCPTKITTNSIFELNEVQKSIKQAMETYHFLSSRFNPSPKLLNLYNCCYKINGLFDRLEKENNVMKSAIVQNETFRDLCYVFLYALADRNLLFRPKTCIDEIKEFFSAKKDVNLFDDKALKMYLDSEMMDESKFNSTICRENDIDPDPDILPRLTDKDSFVLYIKTLKTCWENTFSELNFLLNSLESKQYVYKDLSVLKSKLHNKERGRKNPSTKPKKESEVTTHELNPRWEAIKEALVKNLHSRNVFGENGILGEMNDTYKRIIDDALIEISTNYLLQKCVPLYLYFGLLGGESWFDTRAFLSDLKQKENRIRKLNSIESMEDEQRKNCSLFSSILLACLSVPEFMCGENVLDAQKAVEVVSNHFGVSFTSEETNFLVEYTNHFNTFSRKKKNEYKMIIRHKEVANVLRAISMIFWYQTWNPNNISLAKEASLKHALKTIDSFVNDSIDHTAKNGSDCNFDRESSNRKYEHQLNRVLEEFSSHYCAFNEELFWFITGFVPSDSMFELWYIKEDQTEKNFKRSALKSNEYYVPSFYLAIESKFEELWDNSAFHSSYHCLPPNRQGRQLRQKSLDARSKMAKHFEVVHIIDKYSVPIIMMEFLECIDIGRNSKITECVHELKKTADDFYFLDYINEQKTQPKSSIKHFIENEYIDEFVTQVYISFRTIIFEVIGRIGDFIWPINAKDIKIRLSLPDRYDSPGGDA